MIIRKHLKFYLGENFKLIQGGGYFMQDMWGWGRRSGTFHHKM